MIHPALTPVGSSTPTWLAAVGPTGSWGDLQWTTRWGEGACGMFEAQWSMPLPPGFEHPLLRRGTLVELMDGPYRVGSPLILSEPARGAGYEDPWRFVATGIGREVEGENSFLCLDASLNATTNAVTAVDQAIARGLRWGGRDVSVPNVAWGPAESDQLNTIGALLSSLASAAAAPSRRWGVGQDNLVRFMGDPTTPTYHTVPGVASLGTADDDYATAVYVRYLDDTSGGYETVKAPSTASATETMFGRKEYPVDITTMGAMAAATAQAHADGILARAKGRLAWVNGLTLTSNELLTSGGVPADLSMVEAGQMVRLHGVFPDLLATTGQTWLDIVIGETRYTDGASTVDINPLGLAARDLAAIVESVTGVGDVAA